mgnify:CR=1 FL=1
MFERAITHFEVNYTTQSNVRLGLCNLMLFFGGFLLF